MPYSKLSDLPSNVKALPQHAQEIYQAAFNSAWEQHKGEDGAEPRCHAIAWTAVKGKYKKNDRGDWVAKESTKEAVHPHGDHVCICSKCGNEITVEAGMKCNEQVCPKCGGPMIAQTAGERRESAANESALTGTSLKEQNMKTEDGVQYPAEAYAYVPDADKPSTWKLRLWEDLQKKVTRSQLGRAAAALSPGGFRGQKVDIPREDLPAVKRKIRSEYRKLDVADEDIPKWVMEAGARTILADFTLLSEATVSGKGVATIVVIKPGLNSSKERYYPPEVLARDYVAFEGVKMYADHPTEQDEKQRPERSIRDWVATLKNVHVDSGGQLVGEAVIVEPWMQQKLAALRDKGMLQEMGISINAVGSATKGEIDGVKTNIVERIIRVRSVDFVTEPGAGGMVQMYEAGNENDVDVINLETLRERRPDLVTSIETEVKAAAIKEVKQKMELEEKVKELETNIENLTKERDELKGKITEAERAQRIAEAKSKIDEAISKAELPEPSKARLLEHFKSAETADGVTEAIKAELDYIAALKEAGKVKGLGSTSEPNVAKDQLKESFKRLGMTDKEAEIAVGAH